MSWTPIDRARAAAIPVVCRRGRRAVSPPPPMGRAIETILASHARASGATSGPALTRIARDWADMAGADVAAVSRPVKLTGRGAKGVLHLAARGPAAMLLQADARRILDRVNTYSGAVIAGKLTVARVSVLPSGPASTRFAPPPPPPAPPQLDAETAAKLQQSLASVEHPALKQALEALGRAVIARDPPRHA